MQYFISFLEGIITFVSPCLLPMLPIYLSYFAGSRSSGGRRGALRGSLGFVAGFTIVFLLLGAFAGTAGQLLRRYSVYVNLAAGLVVILFGLNFMGVLRIGFLNRIREGSRARPAEGFFPALLFGMAFSISWTPCVGAFLGSALLLASQQGSAARGILLLLCYSLGLGIPFVMSALLIGRLKTAFDWIKRHYRVINLVSGGFLVLVGVLMATGALGWFLSLLSP